MRVQRSFLTGCDVHDKTLVTQSAVDAEDPTMNRWPNEPEGRSRMVQYLKGKAKDQGARRVIVVYEASGFGFGLHDELNEAGIECYVVAPTKIRKSSRDKKDKSDAKDALRLLEVLRAHVLAGNELPLVWVPDTTTRDDRERVRARLDLGRRMSSVKVQILSLLRRNGIERRDTEPRPWTRAFRYRVEAVASGKEPGLGEGAQVALLSLLRQLGFWEEEEKELDREVARLSGEQRYAGPANRLMSEAGVGLMTAMVFLTEMGDMSRFPNRRKVAAYLGLAPSTYESGESGDRKGHISREGPGRVRKMLCQAAWHRLRRDPREQAIFQRMVSRNPKKKKIYLVAMMRRLSIRMWHWASKTETEMATA